MGPSGALRLPGARLAHPSLQPRRQAQLAGQPRPVQRHLAGGALGGSRRRRGGAAVAAAQPSYPPLDPDAYEHEPSEDPDEYGDYAGPAQFISSVGSNDGGGAAPWSAAADGGPRSTGSNGSSGGGNVWGAGWLEVEPTQTVRRRHDEPDGLSRGASLLLLAASAVHRLGARLATAVLATGRAAVQLGGDALQGLHAGTKTTTKTASEAFATSPAYERVRRFRSKLEAVQKELPEDLWGKVMWVWDRPHVQKIRLTISMANFSIRLPALVALVATQVGLLSTSLSLPMLAPLLLGTGMLLRSIRTNASLVFPRIGLLVVLLWLLWFANSVIQNTLAYLRKQGAIDQRLASNINSAAELAALTTAGVVLLSMLGVNVSALLLPAGVMMAVAAKDLSHNFLAGFFLMMVQPFRLGDRVGVTLPSGPPNGSFGASGAWFEGVCEKVDLRYTSLRQGKRRLMVPNSAFLQQPFMITEDAPTGAQQPPHEAGPPGSATHPFTTYDGRNVWQSYMSEGPVHAELQAEQHAAAAAAAAAYAGAGAGMHGPADPAVQQQAQQAQQAQQMQQPYGAMPPPQPNGQQYAQPQPNGQQQQQQPLPQQQYAPPPNGQQSSVQPLPPQQQPPVWHPHGQAALQQQQQAQQQQPMAYAPHGQAQAWRDYGYAPQQPPQQPPPGGYPGVPPPPGSPMYNARAPLPPQGSL